MGRRGPKQEVDLIEEDGPGDPPDGDAPEDGGPSGTAGTDAAHVRRRRATTLGVGLLVVLVLVGVVGQAVVTARERDRLAAVAALPDVVAPLDGPPQILWTSDEDIPFQVTTSAGHVAGAVTHPDGRVVARAVDLATGRTVWEVDLLTAADSMELPAGAVPAVRGSAYCWPGTPDNRTSDVMLCTADNAVWLEQDGTMRWIAATVTRLVLLDARDGTVVADLTDEAAAAPVAESSTTLGDLVLLTGRTSDGAEVRAVRRDGTVAWRTTVPAPPPAEPEPGGSPEQLQLLTAGDHAALVTPDAVHLLDATGATVRRTPRAADAWVTGSTDGTVVLGAGGAYAPPGGPPQAPASSTFIRPDGEVTRPGEWVWLGVDDGTAPFTTLTWDVDGLHAWGREDAPLWTADVRLPHEAVALDGLVHLTDGTGLLTLDAGTGAEVWRVTDLRSDTPLMTDGRVLLVTAGSTLGEDGGTRLVALDRKDGSEVWRAPTPVDVDSLWPVGGFLLGQRWDHDVQTNRAVVTALG
ncbi:outer membrane protein assembly factor BamB family protein [Cellulomonas wangsupingiae]|uniref:PQQ-binding-like beta-propeller repeat protein n=1 Tax=Cellulomonas wangsupingiae TaxID=2968085 RepID=A0ABY5K9L7_9CELL|nr:PQQ-binding-like beta-propeller repeat protein [Cellulomonas wangsupingiae]MCC2336379.1 PQQ-binding-like beta-propeller repeat protein [Cellulomonas wangsupingiae]UUI65646.1 PQQ-binding-like beta-propeller repeat protein [Cellulomonas wangsupingiae]